MWSAKLSHMSKLIVTSQTRSHSANCHTEINSKGTKGASVLVLFYLICSGGQLICMQIKKLAVEKESQILIEASG